MRTRPPPLPDEDETDPSLGELVSSLTGLALLGLGAFELHRRGKLGETLVSLVEAIANGPPGPPQPRTPKRRRPKRKRERRQTSIPSPPANEDAIAAQLLGVPVDASIEQIRAAFRGKVNERLSHGVGFGDLARTNAEQKYTLALTTAKNRLLERARRGLTR